MIVNMLKETYFLPNYIAEIRIVYAGVSAMNLGPTVKALAAKREQHASLRAIDVDQLGLALELCSLS